MNNTSNLAPAISKQIITEQEIFDAQKQWDEGLIRIGKIYMDNGDYKSAAIEHINNQYNYQDGIVLFKPTLASQKQFRTDFKGALSYFISEDENYPEDIGFALTPWVNIRWENIGTKIFADVALATGNYYLTPLNSPEEVKVEYSFAYIKDKEGRLKIVLHGSHFPYKPTEVYEHN